MQKGNKGIRFNIVIKTNQGTIFATYIKRRNALELQGGMVVKEGSRMNIDRSHDLLGHSNKDNTRATAKHLGWELSKSAKPRKSCAKAKAEQKIVLKRMSRKKASRPNERLFQDLATVKVPEALNITVTRPYWQMIVDERTNMKFLSHHETKDGMVEPTCVKLSKLADIAGKVVYLRQDNAGENVKLAKRMGSAD